MHHHCGHHRGHNHDHGDWSHGRHHGCRHGHGQPDTPEEKFNKLSEHIIKADEYAKKLCENQTNVEVQEMYNNKAYHLIYKVPSSHVDKITIKIKHRVVYMFAQQVGDKTGTFSDVRVFPNMLKIADAYWQYKDDHVTLTIPYNMTLEKPAKIECASVNENVTTIPYAPAIIERFAN